jgi:hypothetical protein
MAGNDLTPLQEELLNKFALFIVKKGLTPVAIFMLETHKPLSFLGNQLLVFFQPVAESFLPPKEYRAVMELLEDRNNVETFIQIIENTEKEYQKRREENGKEKAGS